MSHLLNLCLQEANLGEQKARKWQHKELQQRENEMYEKSKLEKTGHKCQAKVEG